MASVRELADDEEKLRTAPLPLEMAPFADIPKPIWIAFLSAWSLLFGLFILAFATDGRAALVVFTASFFAMMALGLPAVMCIQSKGPQCRSQIIATRCGPLTIGQAATQILLIPVCTVIGLTAFIVLAM
jgi:hypothetical protein